MVASFPHVANVRTRTWLALLGLAYLLHAPGALHAAGPKRSDLPIDIQAATSEVDYRNNTVLFRQVAITQGTVKITADEATATGLDFSNSRWVLRGNVRITVDGGSLASDQASISFLNDQIASAVITGSPASFEQKLEDSADIARGHAGTIEYDFTDGTVRLAQDAYLTDGHHDIRGQTLVYNIREQRVMADASQQGNERVRITINPRSVEDAQKNGADRPQ